jgi:hypothetical protein
VRYFYGPPFHNGMLATALMMFGILVIHISNEMYFMKVAYSRNSLEVGIAGFIMISEHLAANILI